MGKKLITVCDGCDKQLAEEQPVKVVIDSSMGKHFIGGVVTAIYDLCAQCSSRMLNVTNPKHWSRPSTALAHPTTQAPAPAPVLQSRKLVMSDSLNLGEKR